MTELDHGGWALWVHAGVCNVSIFVTFPSAQELARKFGKEPCGKYFPCDEPSSDGHRFSAGTQRTHSKMGVIVSP